MSALHKMLVSAALASSFFAQAYTPGKTYKVTILHTNDHHGVFWKNEENEYGMAARATLIEKQRQELKAQGVHVLLLDGGDVNTGTPESEMADAEPDFRGMNLMKYDAMAVGNHEFDKPFDILLKQQKWATFPFLSANIYEKKSGKRFFDATKKFKIEDLNVSVFGLTTEQTPQQSIRFPDKLELRNPVSEAAKLVPQLRKTSDIVIAVTHMGHYPNEQHGSRAPGDVTLARKVNGIDLIVGGHTQLPLFNADYENGTYIVQAGEWGKYLGRVDLEFKDGKVKMLKYELLPVNFKGQPKPKFYEEDPAMLAQLKPFKDKAVVETGVIVGKLDGNFEGSRAIIRKQETNLGNFVTYLMASSTDSELAVIDSGVIRTGLNAGNITYGQIVSVHPLAFAFNYVTIDFSGKELHDYLQKVAPLTDGSYPQFYGVKVKLKNNQLVSVLLKDKKSGEFLPLNEKQTYKLCTTDFLASGGDSYPVISKHPKFKNTKLIDSQVMRKFFEENKIVKAADYPVLGNVAKE